MWDGAHVQQALSTVGSLHCYLGKCACLIMLLSLMSLWITLPSYILYPLEWSELVGMGHRHQDLHSHMTAIPLFSFSNGSSHAILLPSS